MSDGCRSGNFIGDIDRNRNTDTGTALGTDCCATGNILDFIFARGRHADIARIRGQGDIIPDFGGRIGIKIIYRYRTTDRSLTGRGASQRARLVGILLAFRGCGLDADTAGAQIGVIPDRRGVVDKRDIQRHRAGNTGIAIGIGRQRRSNCPSLGETFGLDFKITRGSDYDAAVHARTIVGIDKVDRDGRSNADATAGGALVGLFAGVLVSRRLRAGTGLGRRFGGTAFLRIGIICILRSFLIGIIRISRTVRLLARLPLGTGLGFCLGRYGGGCSYVDIIGAAEITSDRCLAVVGQNVERQ